MNKLVILDRDGVINVDSPNFIKSPEEWLPIPKSLEAIAKLNKAGFRVVVATNQSGIARGLFDLKTLEAIHQKMQTALQPFGGIIDHIFFCPHKDEDNCNCRKPKPGLLQQIAKYYQIDTQNQSISSVPSISSIPSIPCIPCIGDSLRDLQAAEAVGWRPILVLTGNGEKTLQSLSSHPLSSQSLSSQSLSSQSSSSLPTTFLTNEVNNKFKQFEVFANLDLAADALIQEAFMEEQERTHT